MTGKRGKEHTFKLALNEFEFVRKRVDRSFPLLYSLFMYEYQIYMQLGEFDSANKKMRELMLYKKKLKKK